MNYTHQPIFSAATALLASCAILAGCGDDGAPSDASPTSSSSSSSAGSGGGTGEGGAGGGGGGGTGGATEPPPPPQTRATLSGDITWQVTFDDAALAAGATNCSYTRRYQGVEDRSAPWLCPTCEVMFRVDVQVTAGLQDCYPQVSAAEPATVEWLGYDKNGTFRRGNGGPLSEQGTATATPAGFDVANAVMDVPAPVGGSLAFNVGGSLTRGDEEGDPMNGWVAPETYACGWPKANPPAYEGDYVLARGSVVPDGLFKDACEQVVRLHDLKGAYLLIDMSAMDCGPCQQMASEEERFVANMAAQGITVRVVTLLAPSLADVVGLTTTSMLTRWIDQFELSSPVLGDRGWGISMFEPAIGASYPSSVLVDPDLQVIDFASGYAGFGDFEAAIAADAAP